MSSSSNSNCWSPSQSSSPSIPLSTLLPTPKEQDIKFLTQLLDNDVDLISSSPTLSEWLELEIDIEKDRKHLLERFFEISKLPSNIDRKDLEIIHNLLNQKVKVEETYENLQKEREREIEKEKENQNRDVKGKGKEKIIPYMLCNAISEYPFD